MLDFLLSSRLIAQSSIADPVPLSAPVAVAWTEIAIQLLPTIGLAIFCFILGAVLFRGKKKSDSATEASPESEAREAEKARITDFESALDEAKAEQEKLVGQLAESQEQNRRSEEELATLNREQEDLRKELEEKESRIESLLESAAAAEALKEEEPEPESESADRKSDTSDETTKVEEESVEEAEPTQEVDHAAARLADEAASRVRELEEEMQNLRFSAAARDGAIAKLRQALDEKQGELDALREAISSGENVPLTPEAAEANPIASRLAPFKERSWVSAAGNKGGNRKFVRQLLGIGGDASSRGEFGRKLISGKSAHASARPISAASLAEARTALDNLKQAPVVSIPEATSARNRDADDQPKGPQNGNRFESEESPEKSPEDETLEQLNGLKAQIQERDARIADLEAELAEFRQGDLPALPPLMAEAVDDLEPEIAASESDAFEIASGDSVPVSDEEIVLFRGTDPGNWNRSAGTLEGEGDFSRPIDEAPESMGYLRVRRLDTGDSVVATLSREDLLAGGSAKAPAGWSGRGEEYFGALHLGLFDSALPREVEIKFGAGGWGFGHRESIGSGQALGWAGEVLEENGAGIEISVGPLPGESDLAAAAASGQPDIDATQSVAALEEFPQSLEDIEVETSDIVSAQTVAAALAEQAAEEEKAVELPDEKEAPVEEAPESAGASDADMESMAKQADKRTGGLVLFRSNDPKLWGTDVFSGANRRSRSLDRLPDGLAYLRLRRIDTGEGIVVPVTNESLRDDGDGAPRGFNGTNELFYGARHLGLFDENVSQQVETRFTYGGWGFGHSVVGAEEQACGWAGERISSDTVFEISVFRRMPILGDRDQLWDLG